MSAKRIYYTFSALIGLGMGAITTVYVPFLLSIGLSLAQVALVNTLFWGVLIVSELPTGLFADGRSRAFSLTAGAWFHAFGALAYIFAEGFWSAAFAEGLIAIGMAFLSGAQQAWIADALERENRQDELRRVYASEAFLRAGTFLIGGFLGVVLALLSYRLIWLPAVLTSIAAALLCGISMNGQGEPLERVSEGEAFTRSWSHLKSSRALLWVVSAMVLFGAVVSFNHFWSPYFEAKVGTIGLSWVWVVIYVAYASAGWQIRRLSIPLGAEGTYIALALLLCGVSLAMFRFTSGLAIPLSAVFIHEIGRGMFQPLTDSFIQHRVGSAYRATFGSLASLIGRGGFALVPLLVWIGIDGKPDTSETITSVWLVCGVVLALGALLSYLVRPRV